MRENPRTCTLTRLTNKIDRAQTLAIMCGKSPLLLKNEATIVDVPKMNVANRTQTLMNTVCRYLKIMVGQLRLQLNQVMIANSANRASIRLIIQLRCASVA